MPVIITVHIAKSSARWGASQRPVIIQTDGPLIGPYMSRPMGTIHAQLSSVRTSNDAMTRTRS